MSAETPSLRRASPSGAAPTPARRGITVDERAAELERLGREIQERTAELQGLNRASARAAQLTRDIEERRSLLRSYDNAIVKGTIIYPVGESSGDKLVALRREVKRPVDDERARQIHNESVDAISDIDRKIARLNADKFKYEKVMLAVAGQNTEGVTPQQILQAESEVRFNFNTGP
jgi:hypothetical protein